MLAFKIMFLWFSITETRTHDISKIQIRSDLDQIVSGAIHKWRPIFYNEVFDQHIIAWFYHGFMYHCKVFMDA